MRRGVGGTHVMCGRSRITIDPHNPTMPKRSTSGFHGPERLRLHQAPSAVRCWASRMKGELQLTRNRLAADLHMDDRAQRIDLFFGVATPKRQQ